MILTPEQMEDPIFMKFTSPWAETIRAYADIVQKVALFANPVWEGKRTEEVYDDFGMCTFCGEQRTFSDYDGHEERNHAPDCLYLAARKLRGLE